jgi:hypothetical protein
MPDILYYQKLVFFQTNRVHLSDLNLIFDPNPWTEALRPRWATSDFLHHNYDFKIPSSELWKSLKYIPSYMHCTTLALATLTAQTCRGDNVCAQINISGKCREKMCHIHLSSSELSVIRVDLISWWYGLSGGRDTWCCFLLLPWTA